MKKCILFCYVTLFFTNLTRAQTEITFYTTMGDFVVEAYDTLQPITAGNFIDLVNAEFYDGILIHRVVSDFIIQGGDPLGTGFGGPGYSIPDEFDPMTSNVQMAISMANSGPNTAGSQFFINLVNNTFLDPNYPVFGIVTENFSVVEDIGEVPVNSNDKPLTDVVMDSVRVTLVGPHVGITNHEVLDLELSVFPNPATDQIFIHLGNKTIQNQEYYLRITNLVGQTLVDEYLTAQTTTIDVSTRFREGIYLVEVIHEATNTKGIKKMVIQ